MTPNPGLHPAPRRHARWMGFLLAFSLSVALSTVAAPAQAKSKAKGKVSVTAPTKKKVRIKKAPATDSGEKPAERARRLTRECKGRPNAGACSGYAS